jgi:acyl-coenzyme A thioesterase PaaI-like protein
MNKLKLNKILQHICIKTRRKIILKKNKLQAKTHSRASSRFVGRPVEIEEGISSISELLATEDMAVDLQGLVHGGFIFGLADYAAMLAVNSPFVVLGSAQVKFIAPVKVGDMMKAYAKVESIQARRREVSVEVKVGEKTVFSGSFLCIILDKHVLS